MCLLKWQECTAVGWFEVLGFGYIAKEIGGVLYINANYHILKRFSIGLYAYEKWYGVKTYTPIPGVVHQSPNAISYGLSAGFNF